MYFSTGGVLTLWRVIELPMLHLELLEHAHVTEVMAISSQQGLLLTSTLGGRTRRIRIMMVLVHARTTQIHHEQYQHNTQMHFTWKLHV